MSKSTRSDARRVLRDTLRYFSRYPKRWIKHASARVSRRGPHCNAFAKDATCFCLSGAAFHFAGQGKSRVAREVIDILGTVLHPRYGSNVIAFNDARSTTVTRVRERIRLALKAA